MIIGAWRSPAAIRSTTGASAREHLGADGDWLDFADPTHGRYRGARILDGRLQACLFIAPTPQLPRSGWLAALFQADRLADTERASLLSGRPPRGQRDIGERICACFDVGQAQIIEAIVDHGLTDVDGIGAALQAGTNCGSCIPQLNRLLAAHCKEA